MGKHDTKRVLWGNLSRLMISKWGKENLTRLATEAKVGPATVTRMKGQETSVGLDVIEAIAEVFDVEPWQLLVPELEPAALPTLGGDASGWPMPMVNKRRFTDLPPDSRLFVQGYLLRCVEEQEALCLANAA